MECAGDPVAREMRLLRAGPQDRAVGPRIDDGAGRTHAGIRLKRPPAFRSRIASSRPNSVHPLTIKLVYRSGLQSSR
jgi:hypothetical protein